MLEPRTSKQPGPGAGRLIPEQECLWAAKWSVNMVLGNGLFLPIMLIPGGAYTVNTWKFNLWHGSKPFIALELEYCWLKKTKRCSQVRNILLNQTLFGSLQMKYLKWVSFWKQLCFDYQDSQRNQGAAFLVLRSLGSPEGTMALSK